MKTTSEKLQFARTKLQIADIPFQIRVASYLRISCLVLDPTGGQYSKLMRALYHYDTDWWKTCQIKDDGGLQSSDFVVANLLAPIEALYVIKPLLLAA